MNWQIHVTANANGTVIFCNSYPTKRCGIKWRLKTFHWLQYLSYLNLCHDNKENKLPKYNVPHHNTTGPYCRQAEAADHSSTQRDACHPNQSRQTISAGNILSSSSPPMDTFRTPSRRPHALDNAARIRLHKFPMLACKLHSPARATPLAPLRKACRFHAPIPQSTTPRTLFL